MEFSLDCLGHLTKLTAAPIYRKMEYFCLAKFSRFSLKNMRINIRVF